MPVGQVPSCFCCRRCAMTAAGCLVREIRTVRDEDRPHWFANGRGGWSKANGSAMQDGHVKRGSQHRYTNVFVHILQLSAVLYIYTYTYYIRIFPFFGCYLSLFAINLYNFHLFFALPGALASSTVLIQL